MNDKPSVMKTVIIEDEKAAVRNLTSLLNEVKPEAEIIAIPVSYTHLTLPTILLV